MAFRFKVGEGSGRDFMSVHSLVASLCIFGALSPIALAQAVIEGHVELPKSHAVPVMSKRYEIVTKGGVLATSPPLAVVYLEGSFPKKAAPGTIRHDLGTNIGNNCTHGSDAPDTAAFEIGYFFSGLELI